MKIGSVGVIVFAGVAAKVADWDAVAAFIVVRRGMQWHVQIADEMDDVADGVRALVWIGLRIFEYSELFGDSLSDSTGFTAETCEGTPGRPARDVNGMPGAVFQRVADVVRPGGAVGEEAAGKRAAIALELRVHRIFLQQRFQKLSHFRREMFLGNQRDGLVALASPRKNRRRNEQCRQQRETGKSEPAGANTHREFLWSKSEITGYALTQ